MGRRGWTERRVCWGRRARPAGPGGRVGLTRLAGVVGATVLGRTVLLGGSGYCNHLYIYCLWKLKTQWTSREQEVQIQCRLHFHTSMILGTRAPFYTIVQKQCCAIEIRLLSCCCLVLSCPIKESELGNKTCLWCRTDPVCLPQSFLFNYFIQATLAYEGSLAAGVSPAQFAVKLDL